MRKIIVCLFTFISIAIIFNSCKKEEESFDETLLYGTWKQTYGTDILYYTYNSGGTGKYWYNTQPVDLHRDIEWTLNKADFRIKQENNDHSWGVYEDYIITSPTSTTLKFRDDADGGKEYVQTKVSK